MRRGGRAQQVALGDLALRHHLSFDGIEGLDRRVKIHVHLVGLK